ncbi:Type 1 glutamine amidotransferase-like domain-containing protein [Paraburkholderia kirstenboschensis]|uniref:Type 1 glutamine amidotransferase-like domain-containing protein n=1 Tax=Paraburkholderia kirstenboschensis TaxID=1245436 RepID=UPI000B045E90|nr:Type 1 glutamine amidotransferase-like domain-containing protein [Paraburkholderia kirstenboschensis]
MRRILAIGGFTTDEGFSLTAAYIRDLTGKAKPRVCLLSTPAGDPPMLIRNFEDTYGKLGFETSNVSFFGPAGTNFVSPDDAAEHLLKQDAIFVSGGNPRCAVGLWKEWGLDSVLREAWQRGVLLSGISAGANCWFKHSIPPPHKKRALPLEHLLGLLPGNCAVHYHARRQETWETMRMLDVPSAIAIDDDAAVLYEGDVIAEVLSWREGATAYQLESQSTGVDEHALRPRVIGSVSREPERQPVFVDVELKRACVGRFELMNPLQVLITIEGEQLFAQYGAQPKLEIFPESENRYFLKAVSAQVTFDRDPDGKVTSLVHHQNGRDAHGVRLGD